MARILILVQDEEARVGSLGAEGVGNDNKDGLVLITGGAGFIGSNLASHYLSLGRQVRVFDNLSRTGADVNLRWLRSFAPPGQLEVAIGDVRDHGELRRVVADAAVAFHLASQVAVTTSIQDPRYDFEVNALGTLNLLEAARESRRRPIVVFSSSNKVYGCMEGASVELSEGGYRLRDLPQGVPEWWPLDFCSPYGCSKGAADQYVRDYARIYGLPTVVFRQSCIYGPRQFGNEDQGWVAHFTISAVLGHPIVLYGDGHQVRDILHVEDLVMAYQRAVERIEVGHGRVYNLGGGPRNAVSLRQLVALLEDGLGRRLEVSAGDWRPGDQRVYISDVRRAGDDLLWRPEISVRRGILSLLAWVKDHTEVIEGVAPGAHILPT